MPGKMTLHEAIRIVLSEDGDGMCSAVIADRINHRKLYYRQDRTAIRASQISARANKYPSLFRRKDNRICLA